jgi:hypothetical protein
MVSSVADRLRQENGRPRTVEGRIRLALRLGESDVEIYREAAGRPDREQACRELAERRRIGRIRSVCCEEPNR